MTGKGREIAEKKNYKRALGSLGGGNNFTEIAADEEGETWIVIHSGSRGVGHAISTHYMKLAHPDGKCKDGHHYFLESCSYPLTATVPGSTDFGFSQRCFTESSTI